MIPLKSILPTASVQHYDPEAEPAAPQASADPT